MLLHSNKSMLVSCLCCSSYWFPFIFSILELEKKEQKIAEETVEKRNGSETSTVNKEDGEIDSEEPKPPAEEPAPTKTNGEVVVEDIEKPGKEEGEEDDEEEEKEEEKKSEEKMETEEEPEQKKNENEEEELKEEEATKPEEEPKPKKSKEKGRLNWKIIERLLYFLLFYIL